MRGGSIQSQAEALRALHEVVTPPPIRWVPQTMGWYALGALIGAGLAWGATRAYRRWRANRYRRAALLELDRIRRLASRPSSRNAALRELPVLVKRTVLSSAERAGVGSLAGEEWLAYLDRTRDGDRFTRGAGRRLLDLAYGSEARLAALGEDEIAGLFDLLRQWISRHGPLPSVTPNDPARTTPAPPSPPTPASSTAGAD